MRSILFVVAILTLVSAAHSQPQQAGNAPAAQQRQQNLTPEQIEARKRIMARQEMIKKMSPEERRRYEYMMHQRRQAAAANKQRTVSDGVPAPESNSATTKDKKPAYKPARSPFEEIAQNSKITDVRNEDFDKFLEDEKSVTILVECILDIKSCTSPSISNLLHQVTKLGVGAKCDTCTKQEQEDLNDKLYRFVFVFQTKYRSYWRQILPRLGFLLGTSRG